MEVAAWAQVTGRRLTQEDVTLLFEITKAHRAFIKNKGKADKAEMLPDNVAPADHPEAVALSMKWAALDAKKREAAKPKPKARTKD